VNALLSQCPVCGDELAVTRLYCPACSTTIEGRFAGGPFARLSAEQLDFLETFVRCEGKFTRMEGELGLSYPTLRSRLHELIRALGYEPGADEAPEPIDDEERRQILLALDEGTISAEEAMSKLKGGRKP
jgi:hypothetical protein